MNGPEVDKAQFTTLFGVFSLIMMAIFAAEVTVMQLYSEWFLRLSIAQSAFLDASTLVAIIALPLWFFVFRPAYCEAEKTGGCSLKSALLLYATVLAGLYSIQLLIMFLLAVPGLAFYVPAQLESLLDGALTILFSAPLFWWLLYRLKLNCRLEPLADFLNAPITLYILLLFMIFLADILQEIIFHQLNVEMPGIGPQLFDAIVSIVLIAPLLLILVVKPLTRLAHSEKARTNIIYDQVMEGIVKIDLNGTIQSFNLAAQNIFGVQAGQMLGESVSVLFDRDQIDIKSALQTLVTDGERKPLKYYELQSAYSSGKILTIDVSISKVQLDGPDEFLLLLRDISKSKATEKALLETDATFREIFNQTEDGILFFNPENFEILDVNPRAESLYGFSKYELQKQGIEAFCDNDATERLRKMLHEVDESNRNQINRLVNRRKDGQQIVASIYGKKIILKGTQIIYCTTRDITERVRLEEEARRIQTKLIHTNKMTSLGQLVSSVAHEINNPNNFMLANAQMLSGIWKDAQLILQQYYREHGDFMLGGISFSELEEQAPELFHGITDGSRRITAIVKDLKRFVRQDPEQAAVDVDINDVVSSAVSILRHELLRHTDNFFIDLAAALPPVKGSGQQLGQVVINLLMNACQALPDKSCSIWLETGYDPQHRLIKISVRDQGRGMSEELKDKILEPFFSTKLDSGGTGLGLSISQTIVKSHGGQIVFFSQPQKGTTFTVTLPVAAT